MDHLESSTKTRGEREQCGHQHNMHVYTVSHHKDLAMVSHGSYIGVYDKDM